MYRKRILLLTLLFAASCLSSLEAQEKQYKVGCVAFYNCENLFDTINDPLINDEEFLPEGINKWDSRKYKLKLERLAEVITQLGDELVKGGPVVIGLSEVENRSVLEDLILTGRMKEADWGIVHYDSPDERGVDVALLYQKSHFTVTNSLIYPLALADGDKTRDQLVVSGIFDGEPVHFIVNHWPSRSGGEKVSAPKRAAAADLCLMITDSICHIDPSAKIIIMGDLNDDPSDESLLRHLKAKKDIESTGPGELYNPMYNMYRKMGLGSLAYRDAWSLFDQMVLSYNLLGPDRKSYKFMKARIFNKSFLAQKEGQYRGYPFRTFAGGVYQGGYSDHFPVYLFLVREK